MLRSQHYTGAVVKRHRHTVLPGSSWVQCVLAEAGVDAQGSRLLKDLAGLEGLQSGGVNGRIVGQRKKADNHYAQEMSPPTID